MEYCSEDPNCTNPWCSCGDLYNTLYNVCSVHPCQHRSPPAIGGDSYYREQNTKIMNVLLGIVGDEFDNMDDLKRYIEEYIL